MRQPEKLAVLPMFSDGASKLNWAERNLYTLDRHLQNFTKERITVRIDKSLPDKSSQDIIYTVDPLKVPISLVVGDIIRNIRASLDHHISSIYRNQGLRDDNCYFPIGTSKAELNGTIKGTIEKNGLHKMSAFFSQKVEATKDGKGKLIWGLNRIDRANKHRSLVTVSNIINAPMVDYCSSEGGSFSNNLIMPGNGDVIRTSGVAECNFFIVPTSNNSTREWRQRVPSDINLEAAKLEKPRLDVRFGKDEIFSREPVIPTLHLVLNCVGRTLFETQEEYKKQYIENSPQQ